MKKKILLIALFTLLFTGCKATYKLKIDEGIIKEELTVLEADKEKRDIKDESERSFTDYAKIYGDTKDIITNSNYFYSDTECVENCSYYDRGFINDSDNVGFKLSHEFTYDEYKDSTIANEWIPNFYTKFDGRYLTIRGGGSWNYLSSYDSFDELEIQIETDYRVVTSNANIRGTTHTWNITKNDLNRTNNINIVIDTQTKKDTGGVSDMFVILLLLALTIVGLVIYIRNKNRQY